MRRLWLGKGPVSAVSSPLVLAMLMIWPTSGSAGGQVAPDRAFSLYVAGDFNVVARTFTTPQDFADLRLDQRKRFESWLGAWQPQKAAFVLELTLTAATVAPAYSLLLLDATQRYALRRPPGPISDADAPFDRVWQQIVIGFLQSGFSAEGVEQYIQALRLWSKKAAGSTWPSRFDLAFGIAQEVRCWATRPSLKGIVPMSLETEASKPVELRTPGRVTAVVEAHRRCLGEALSRFGVAADSDATRAEARVRGAWTLVQLGRWAEARQWLDAADPGDDRALAYWARLMRGRVEDGLGNYDDGLRAFGSAFEIAPGQSAAIGIALMLLKLDRRLEAGAAAELVRSRTGAGPDPWHAYLAADRRFLDQWRSDLRRTLQ